MLLTLARMWLTVTTGEIRPKDVAAVWAAQRMPPPLGAVVARAGELYLEGGFGPWDDPTEVPRAAAHLEREIREAAAS